MTVTFLPIIGCRQHGEVYFQLNITDSSLNRLEYKSCTKWAFSKWKQSVSASSRCVQASLAWCDQYCWNTFPAPRVAGKLLKPPWNIKKLALLSPSSAVSGGLLLSGLFVRALISWSFSLSLDTWEFELSSFFMLWIFTVSVLLVTWSKDTLFREADPICFKFSLWVLLSSSDVVEGDGMIWLLPGVSFKKCWFC